MVQEEGSGVTGGSPLPTTTQPRRSQQAQELLDGLWKNQPKPEDFNIQGSTGMVDASGTDYATARAIWMSEVKSANDLHQSMLDSENNVVKIGDYYVPMGQLGPEQAAAVRQANETLWQKAQNDYNLAGTKLANDKVQGDFNNKLSRLNTGMALDDTRLKKAEQQITRQLNGLGESRNRAQLQTDSLLKAAPFATSGGKTSFSPNDLGGAASGAFSRLGMDPNASLLNYTTAIDINPSALMDQYDQGLGVSGPLQGSPSLLTEAEGMPSLPTLQGASAGYAPSAPSQYDYSQSAGTASLPPVTPSAPATPNWDINPVKKAGTMLGGAAVGMAGKSLMQQILAGMGMGGAASAPAPATGGGSPSWYQQLMNAVNTGMGR